MDVCNSLLQNRMYDSTTKKRTYEIIVSCAAVVSRLLLWKIRFVSCTRFHRLFTIRLKQVCLCILISCLRCSHTRAASPSARPMGRGNCGDVRSQRSEIYIRRCEDRWRWHTPLWAINNMCCYLCARIVEAGSWISYWLSWRTMTTNIPECQSSAIRLLRCSGKDSRVVW